MHVIWHAGCRRRGPPILAGGSRKEASDVLTHAAQAGIAARSLARGYAPDKAFVIVTLVVTGVLLVGWRAGLAAATPQVPQGGT